MITHYLVKPSTRGELYWVITQDNNTTFIHYGQVGSAGRELPPHHHHTKTVARDYVNRHLNQKHKQGYKKGRQPLPVKKTDTLSHGDQMDGLFRRAADQMPQEHDGNFDDFQPGTSGFQPHQTGTSEIWRSPRKRRTMAQEVVLANRRADYIRMGLSPPSDEDADTDSTGTGGGDPGEKFCGVSPLKKRRSMRLTLKRNTTVILVDVDTMTRQNTVGMTSPTSLVKMDTDKRFATWRSKRQGTSSMLKKGFSQINRMDTLPPEEPPRRQSRLLKRLSTTTPIRYALTKVKLEDQLKLPKIFEDDSDTVLPGNESKPRSWSRAGSKSTGVKSSLGEINEEKPSPEEPQSLQSTSVATRAPCSKTKLKRKLTRTRMKERTIDTALDGPSAKRMRIGGSVSRARSIPSASQKITLPARNKRPVSIEGEDIVPVDIEPDRKLLKQDPEVAVL